jgi:predicted MPP superfamily phosphohydrolase
MKFQYISDIHLEHGNRVKIPKIADNLILAGDIGDPSEDIYSSFLKELSHTFEHIFIICGNHEYYSKKRSMQKTEYIIRELCNNYDNIHFLQNEVFHFSDTDVSIFGTTLWTYIKKCQSWIIKNMISDYRCIPNFTIDLNNKLHFESVQKFNELVVTNSNRKWVVICHHQPQTYLIAEKYKTFILNAAFASDVEEFEKDYIKAVVYGHTHTAGISGKYFCNPIGYPGENENINLQATFEV